MPSALNHVSSLRTDVILSIWLILPAIAIVYYWKWSRSRTVRLINAIPGPEPLPLIGNILHVDSYRDDFYKVVAIDWMKKYGPISRAWIGPRPFVFLATPELAQTILSSPKNNRNTNDYLHFSKWLGNSILLSSGDHWKNRRRIVTPAFHFQNYHSFVDVFNEKSSMCAAEFEQIIETQGSTEVDVSHHLDKCALNIICETAMGEEARVENEKDVYPTNVHKFCQLFIERFQRPWLLNDWIYKMSSVSRESERCVNTLHTFTNKITKNRREMLAQCAKKNTDVVQNGAIEEETSLSKSRFAIVDRLIEASNDGADLDDNGIREEIDTITFAGFDTTSTAMVWFFLLMAKHPEHQFTTNQLIVDELDSVFGEDRDRPCTIQDISELRYLECCIKETLRLYPSLPVIVRRLKEDVEIGGYTVPAGVDVIPSFIGIHHNSDVYPDPGAFKPERFFPENSIGRHPYAFIPFSAGPRNYVGQKYAMVELKIVFANILRRLRFTPSDPTMPVANGVELVLKPKHSIRLIVSKR